MNYEDQLKSDLREILPTIKLTVVPFHTTRLQQVCTVALHTTAPLKIALASKVPVTRKYISRCLAKQFYRCNMFYKNKNPSWLQHQLCLCVQHTACTTYTAVCVRAKSKMCV